MGLMINEVEVNTNVNNKRASLKEIPTVMDIPLVGVDGDVVVLTSNGGADGGAISTGIVPSTTEVASSFNLPNNRATNSGDTLKPHPDSIKYSEDAYDSGYTYNEHLVEVTNKSTPTISSKRAPTTKELMQTKDLDILTTSDGSVNSAPAIARIKGTVNDVNSMPDTINNKIKEVNELGLDKQLDATMTKSLDPAGKSLGFKNGLDLVGNILCGALKLTLSLINFLFSLLLDLLNMLLGCDKDGNLNILNTLNDIGKINNDTTASLKEQELMKIGAVDANSKNSFDLLTGSKSIVSLNATEEEEAISKLYFNSFNKLNHKDNTTGDKMLISPLAKQSKFIDKINSIDFAFKLCGSSNVDFIGNGNNELLEFTKQSSMDSMMSKTSLGLPDMNTPPTPLTRAQIITAIA